MNSAAADVTQPDLARHDSSLLDLAFAMDTTGSMSSYIESARTNIRRIVEEIVSKECSDIRLALVEYRDHPPQENTFVTRVNDFTPRVAEMKRWLEASSAVGGGDTPEAVADALHDVLKLSWRPEATKICVLVSDAPPHGLHRSGDGFPNGCPAGHDPIHTTRQLAEKGVTLYAVGCEPAINCYKEFFATIAYMTGGQYVPLTAAGALTAVIVGGAEEELSLEQWMEQVNQHVMQEVQARGAANVDVQSLSRDVMATLNMGGARSKQLQLNKAELQTASANVRNMSQCTSMATLRTEWESRVAPAAPSEMSFDDLALANPAPPEAVCSFFPAPSMSRGLEVPTGAMAPMPLSAPMGMVPMPQLAQMGMAPMPQLAPMGAMAPMPQLAPVGVNAVFNTTEGEIQMGQAERMVQKALSRNKVMLQKK